MEMQQFPIVRIDPFKSLAKKIGRELDCLYNHALQRLAHAHGYPSYNDLRKTYELQEASPPSEMDPALTSVWLQQVSSAFGTEFDSELGGKSPSEWFRLICTRQRYGLLPRDADGGNDAA
jgi:hypothetical protein